MKKNKYMNRILTFISLLILLSITGCQSDNSDLTAYINDVNKRPGGRIEPLPEMREIQLIERKVYHNPFEPLEMGESVNE